LYKLPLFVFMWITLLLIALSLSADAFAVTISNSLCYPNLTRGKKIAMPIVFGIMQGAMPLAGYYLGSLFAQHIQKIDHWIALVLLAVLGVKMVVETAKENAQKGDCDCDEVQDKRLTFATILMQGVATSIDAMAVGITLALTVPLKIYYSVLVIAAVTFVMCLLGLFLGKYGKFMKKYAGYVGGAVLILTGVKIFVEHMIGA